MNWYSFLGVGPDATAEQIAAAVERLSRQANALAVTAPERARQLRDQIRAIKQDLLSGAEARQKYDRLLAAREAPGHPAPPPGVPGAGAQGPGLMSRISKFLQTGWTCVDCGYGAQPADKFCAKCGGRVESGLAGQPPRCGTCGTWAQPGDAFCMRCGRGLAPGVSSS